ncbi:type I restriction endonuclease [Acidithiobacillus ferriphilus]|uniref:type I restriction endonuclease n=1 Tax=Acidithiobacillus ferriphilus TaxID=1689834 RepID=UPI001E5DE4A7|nr:type I restriction endonuclease [Acidithiobacillus ferriphilus]UEP59579.1 hypothetical protein K1Y48_02665 [Acidithiobacillus ferriphilus]
MGIYGQRTYQRWTQARNNDWLAVNQFTVIEGQNNRRPGIAVFIDGLPLAVIELRNAADEGATIWSAFNQPQTYKQRGSSFAASQERFKVWRTIEKKHDFPPDSQEEATQTVLAQAELPSAIWAAA